MVNFFQQNFYRIFLAVSSAVFFCILIILWFYEASILMRSDKAIGLGVSRHWDIGSVNHVFMRFENTLRYSLDVDSGDGDWDASLPAGGGLIRLGKDKDKHSISMFHQLRCLAIIRNDINGVKGTDRRVPQAGKLTQHCMNYLRQMVLCRADLRLESARNPYGPRIAVSDVTHSCKDWKRIYRAAEDNYHNTS